MRNIIRWSGKAKGQNTSTLSFFYHTPTVVEKCAKRINNKKKLFQLFLSLSISLYYSFQIGISTTLDDDNPSLISHTYAWKPLLSRKMFPNKNKHSSSHSTKMWNGERVNRKKQVQNMLGKADVEDRRENVCSYFCCGLWSHVCWKAKVKRKRG